MSLQEDRHVERVAALEFPHQLVGERVFVALLALLDLGEDTDGAQQVLVRRVVVIHVELHQRDDAAEIRHEAAEDAGLVHQAQRDFGRLFRGEDFEEETVRLLVLPERGVDMLQRARDELQHVGMNVEAVLVGDMEEADDVHRVLLEEGDIRDREAARLHGEAANDLLAAHRLHEAADGGLLLFLLILEHGAEDARQIADILGDQEIMLHEALDGFQPAMFLIAETFGHFGLEIEGDALLGAAGEEVQLAAHRPEEILRLAEGLVFLLREDADLDEIGGLLHAVDIFRDPEKRVEVAKAALAFLHVRLDEVAALAAAGVAHIALGELCLDEFVCRALHHLVVEAGFEFGEEVAVAIDEARLEKRGADGEILTREADAIGDRARRMADLEAEIPERVEHVFDDALAPRRLLVGKQEEEIDVGTGRQRAAAITADGGDGNALGPARVRRGEHVPGREGVELADDRVLEIAEAFGAGAAAMRTLLQPLARLGAAIHERRFQHRNDAALQGEVVLRRGAHGVEPFADGARIGDFKQARQCAAHERGQLLARAAGPPVETFPPPHEGAEADNQAALSGHAKL